MCLSMREKDKEDSKGLVTSDANPCSSCSISHAFKIHVKTVAKISEMGRVAEKFDAKKNSITEKI